MGRCDGLNQQERLEDGCRGHPDSVEHFINPISTGLDRKARLRALYNHCPVKGAGGRLGVFTGSPEEQEAVWLVLVVYRTSLCVHTAPCIE